MPLYHFSDNPDIEAFEPRTPAHRPEVEPLVWAIDAWHAPMYFVPRDCPRVCFWPIPRTTEEDRRRWWAYVDARMVIAIEAAWLERLRAAQLYRYTLPEDALTSLEDAGMYVSRATVVPLAVEPVGDLLDAMRAAEVELRVTPSLLELREQIIEATLHYSIIRMRNARGYVGPAPSGPDLGGVP